MQQAEMRVRELSLEDLALVAGGAGSSSMNIYDPEDEPGSANLGSLFRGGGGKKGNRKGKKKGKKRRK